MWLIVGLGNWEERYLKTKHNFGFLVVDELVKHANAAWSANTKFKCQIANFNLADQKIILIKPKTYVNCSGEAVSLVAAYYNLPVEKILVFHDDLDLPSKKVKFKQSGGTGGHNGLKSIDKMLGNNYYRLRFGIGRPSENFEVSDYVLSKLENNELDFIGKLGEIIYQNLDKFVSGRPQEFKETLDNLI